MLFFIIIANKNTMKPVDKFSIQYSELLEYIYPVTQEYFPDFDYDEETGQAYIYCRHKRQILLKEGTTEEY